MDVFSKASYFLIKRLEIAEDAARGLCIWDSLYLKRWRNRQTSAPYEFKIKGCNQRRTCLKQSSKSCTTFIFPWNTFSKTIQGKEKNK
ncbi:hypothetical protein YC2023_097776 [Brassica napus]